MSNESLSNRIAFVRGGGTMTSSMESSRLPNTLLTSEWWVYNSCELMRRLTLLSEHQTQSLFRPELWDRSSDFPSVDEHGAYSEFSFRLSLSLSLYCPHYPTYIASSYPYPFSSTDHKCERRRWCPSVFVPLGLQAN
jgi:hypothetical protein